MSNPALPVLWRLAERDDSSAWCLGVCVLCACGGGVMALTHLLRLVSRGQLCRATLHARRKYSKVRELVRTAAQHSAANAS